MPPAPRPYLRMTKITETLSKDDIIKALRGLGVTSGMVLEVHSSLGSLGHVIGGAETLVDALIEAVGHNGTLVMPLQASYNGEPARFIAPPMTFENFARYRDQHPGFDPVTTDLYRMGKTTENLRRRKGVAFTTHPQTAFVAYGRYAKFITDSQDMDFSLSDSSPLGKLYGLKAYCLLIGVDYDNMTSLHLAEYRSAIRPIALFGATVKEGDNRKWQKYMDIELDSDDGFLEIGQRLEAKALVKVRNLGSATLKFVRVDTAVDEGTSYYMERKMRYPT